MITNWSAALFTADLSQRFDISSLLLGFNGVVRHLSAGEWEATVASSALNDLLSIWPKDNDATPLGFAVQVPGQIVMSGRVMSFRIERQGASDTLTLSGVDEYAAFATRLAYPQPDNAPPWNTSAYYSFTGTASAAVADVVSRHIGISARPERKMPGLTVVANDAGPVGTWQFRLDAVADAVTQIATEGGLSVRPRRRLDGGLDVLVGPAINRTDLVLDSTVLGDSTLMFSAASATTVIAGGDGEGTARLFAIAGDSVSGAARRESFTDQRNISSLPALQRAADAERAAASAATTFSGSLTNEAADTYLWQRDYDLGDVITLRIGSATWPIQVSGVNVTIDAAGMRLSPVLGFTPKNALVQLLRDVADLQSRLSNLEVS